MQQNRTKISRVNFQVFSFKSISYVAVADRNEQCVVEKENRKYLRHRPFAAGGHMVQNQKYCRAKECDKTSLGNVNKEHSHFSS